MRKHFLFLALMAATLFGAQLQAKTINLSEEGGTDILISDGDTLTGEIKNPSPLDIKIAAGAKIVLSNVSIHDQNAFVNLYSGLTCLGDATLILADKNVVYPRKDGYSGIYIPKGYTLTIEGTGSLEAYGYLTSKDVLVSASGIGSYGEKGCGDIVINNGTITAVGCYGGAGIGGVNCGNITIHGGTITATGGKLGPAIGGTETGACGDITIDNSCGSLNLHATKGALERICIGGHSNTSVSSVGTVTILGTVQPNGGVTTSPFGITTPKWDGDLSNVTAPVVAENGVSIHGTLSTPQKISIAPQATVYLNDATIRANGHSPSCEWAGLTCLSDATIWLQGDNIVQGGYKSSAIFVPVEKNLYIVGAAGSLKAYAKGDGAGIGAGYQKPCGNIYINNGTIEAHGGQYAAGIGGAFIADCGSITISECANITAYKGKKALEAVGAGFSSTNLGVSIGTSCDDYSGGSSSYDLTTSPFIYPIPTPSTDPEPTCLVPTNLQQTGESEPYAVSVSWTQGGSETKWQVGWRLLGSTEDYSSYPVSKTFDEITGLTPDTDYEIAVRAQCDNWGNELSEWSEPIIVTTMALPQPCGMPKNLQTVSITENSITILFAPGSANNTEWEVACKIRATQQDVFRETVTNMIVTIPDLTPNTAYNIWVGAHCDEYSSDYNVLYNVSTLEGTGIEEIVAPADRAAKYLLNGNLYITAPDGKIYNAQGAEVK